VRVTRLKLAKLRAIDAAEFRFLPGFNLIVGVNGVGKTSVLNALGVCLSAVVKRANGLRAPVEAFRFEDIRGGAEALTVECGVQIGLNEYSYLIHKPRESSAAYERKAGRPREQVLDTPEIADFIGAAPMPWIGSDIGGRPLAVLFGTRRAVPSERTPGKNVARGGVAAAFAQAFIDRELRLGEFAAWFQVQQALKAERPAASRALTAFKDVVARFLPGYANLRIDGGGRPTLLIDTANTTLPVRQLSDGERGMLALVLDLTRRLVQANPEMTEPTVTAEAVVLIDEIELHLHPRWQRQIVQNLLAAFPKCQFIATTHSPQVIGEVEHERIQIIAAGQVYAPTHSFGVDSDRILTEIMDTGPRTEEIQDLLARLSRAIGNENYEMARVLLADLAVRVGEDDPEVTRTRTLLEFMEGDK
jgi:hypothetical protein